MASVAMRRIDLRRRAIFNAVLRSRLGRQPDQLFYPRSPRVEFPRVVLVSISFTRRRQTVVVGRELVDGFVVYQIFHDRDQHPDGLERFCQMIIGADAAGPLFVERFEGRNQQNHRRLFHLRTGFDELANLIAVFSRNAYVGHHQRRPQAPQPIDRFVAVIHRYHFDALVRESQRNDLLHRRAVIGEQNFVIHINLRSNPTKTIFNAESIRRLYYSTSIRRRAPKQAVSLLVNRLLRRAAPYRCPDVTRFGKRKVQKERKRPFSLLLYFLPSLWRRSLFGNAGRIFLLFPFLLRIFLFLVFLFRIAVFSFGSRRLVGARRLARLAGPLSGGGG